LPLKASIQAIDPLQRQLQAEALCNTKIRLGQEKGKLLEQLENGNYRLPENSSKTTSTPANSLSSSPVSGRGTTSGTPSPAPTRSPAPKQTKEEAEFAQYQKDKSQIKKNENIRMKFSTGLYTDAQKNRIAQDTWDRQLRAEAYEQKHPEILK